MKTGSELTKEIVRRYQEQAAILKEMHVTEWLKLQTDDPIIQRQLRVRQICALSDLTKNTLLQLANIRSAVQYRPR